MLGVDATAIIMISLSKLVAEKTHIDVFRLLLEFILKLCGFYSGFQYLEFASLLWPREDRSLLSYS